MHNYWCLFVCYLNLMYHYIEIHVKEAQIVTSMLLCLMCFLCWLPKLHPCKLNYIINSFFPCMFWDGIPRALPVTAYSIRGDNFYAYIRVWYKFKSVSFHIECINYCLKWLIMIILGFMIICGCKYFLWCIVLYSIFVYCL